MLRKVLCHFPEIEAWYMNESSTFFERKFLIKVSYLNRNSGILFSLNERLSVWKIIFLRGIHPLK
jgi:hypothetical protein